MPVATVTGNRLMEIRQGFLQLTQRRLPVTSDLKVAMMFGKLRSVLDVYVDKMKELQAEQEAAELLAEGSPERQAAEAAVRKRLLDLGDAKFEIPTPRNKLTESDLPSALKSKDGNGDMNAAGRAAIAVALWPEYFEMKDDDIEAVGDEVDDDEES